MTPDERSARATRAFASLRGAPAQPERGDFDVDWELGGGWRGVRHDTGERSLTAYHSAEAAYDAFDTGAIEWPEPAVVL